MLFQTKLLRMLLGIGHCNLSSTIDPYGSILNFTLRNDDKDNFCLILKTQSL